MRLEWPWRQVHHPSRGHAPGGELKGLLPGELADVIVSAISGPIAQPMTQHLSARRDWSSCSETRTTDRAEHTPWTLTGPGSQSVAPGSPPPPAAASAPSALRQCGSGPARGASTRGALSMRLPFRRSCGWHCSRPVYLVPRPGWRRLPTLVVARGGQPVGQAAAGGLLLCDPSGHRRLLRLERELQ